MPAPLVNVIIPVFNRIDFTRQCIRQLKQQTYPSVRIIVSDGGSTDNSPSILRDEFSDVIVLTSKVELWWAGSMALGIDWVLGNKPAADDYVLMMNNDTTFPPEYIEKLVSVSKKHNGAAVGALTVNAKDHSHILDAGEYVTWQPYRFPVKTTVAAFESEVTDVQVLPGRGSLLTINSISVAGNLRFDKLPHYLSDYEFFYRVRETGTNLVVTYGTWVGSYVDVTGIADTGEKLITFRDWYKLCFHRRSMSNFFDHWQFISLSAPHNVRNQLRRNLVKDYLMLALRRHVWIGPAVRKGKHYARGAVSRTLKLLGLKKYFIVKFCLFAKIPNLYRTCRHWTRVSGVASTLGNAFEWTLGVDHVDLSAIERLNLSAKNLILQGIIFQPNGNFESYKFSRMFLLKSKFRGFADPNIREIYEATRQQGRKSSSKKETYSSAPIAEK